MMSTEDLSDDAPRLDPPAVDRLRREGAVLYDVRPASSYRAERIAGALSLPLVELEARIGELPAGVPLVFY